MKALSCLQNFVSGIEVWVFLTHFQETVVSLARMDVSGKKKPRNVANSYN